MKRLTLSTAVLAILMAPAAFGQSTLNTTAPGASQETKPGQTNNNLQNPGSNAQKGVQQNGTYQEHGTPEGTAAESNSNTATPTTATGATTGTMNNTDTMGTTTGTTGTMNNNDTTGSMSNSNTNTDTTGSYSGSATTSTSTSSSRLPKTASDLPTVAMAGLLALFAAFALRFYSKRNA
jgi:hypothetical protein